MQSWLPDPFEHSDTTITLADDRDDTFSAAGAFPGATTDQDTPPAGGLAFRSEAGFSDAKNLMTTLTRHERAQVFELVEQDVATKYQAQEAALKTEFEQKLAEVKANYEKALGTWTTEFSDNVSTQTQAELKTAAAASARLAIQLAGKIVRSAIKEDQDALVRVIETTLFKIQNDSGLSVSVHPDDAQWLDQDVELKQKLGIENVVADRRVEQGGCIIESAGREWDATLASQLDTLTEIVEEMITTVGSMPVMPEGKDAHEPVLD